MADRAFGSARSRANARRPIAIFLHSPPPIATHGDAIHANSRADRSLNVVTGSATLLLRRVRLGNEEIATPPAFAISSEDMNAQARIVVSATSGMFFNWWRPMDWTMGRSQRAAEGQSVEKEPSAVVVLPSRFRLLANLMGGGAGMIVGLLLILGPGPVWTIAAAGVGSLSVVVFAVAVVRQRPRLVITRQGFTVFKLFGEETRSWEEVEGAFTVVKLGGSQAVTYKLAASRQSRVGKAPVGGDAGVSGSFALPAARIAELLNEHARKKLGSSSH